MNSRQGTRYIKCRMGADLKRTILIQSGITVEDDEALKPKPAVRIAPAAIWSILSKANTVLNAVIL